MDLNPAGATGSYAYGVSGSQQVGRAMIDGTSRAVLWSGTAKSCVDLHRAGATESCAMGVSGGKQAGYAYYGDGISHAILWSGTAASFVDLHPAGVTSSHADAISGGKQAGYVEIGDKTHASLWSGTAKSWVDLQALLPAGVYDKSRAWGINVSNGEIWVVGWAGNISTDQSEAMLWHYTPEPSPK